MISYNQALELLQQHAKTSINSEQILTLNALDRICANDLYSPIDLPSFNNSAMDGFAIHARDTVLASVDNPVKLLVSSTIQAKSHPQLLAQTNFHCCEIMTGAPIPQGFDAVVPVEQIIQVNENNKNYIQITEVVTTNANMRFSGEDVATGNLIIKRGHKLTANDIALLCALGIHQLHVFSIISFALATSGEEIIDDYTKTLSYGTIYNSNAPLLLNLLNQPSFNAKYYGILKDEPNDLISYINNSHEQIIITTGAVSMGRWDFIPETLLKLGAQIVFHKVAIRPGKPILFAILPDGRYFFGLPGNPVSTLIGWRFFIVPLLKQLLTQEPEAMFQFHLTTAFNKKHDLRQFLKATGQIKQGQAQITISNAQESFKIQALTTNDYWVIALEEQHNLASGELINALPMYASF